MKEKNRDKYKEIRHLDGVDRKILNILSENSREKLTMIAKKVYLSIDSTKKRMKKLEKDGIITKYTIQISPARCGLPLSVYIYMKLKNVTKEKYEEFINNMKKNPRIIDLISVLGDYDIRFVILAEDTNEMDEMKMELKQRFSDIIDDWKEVLATKTYKKDEYRF